MPEADLPILGKTMSFDEVLGKALRVNRFTPIHDLEGEKVRGDILGARALLTVEGPNAGQFSILPVYHREDFKNLWAVFEARGLDPDEEVSVTYLPAKFFLKRWFQGRLYVSVYPAGAFELMNKAFTKGDPETLLQIPSAIVMLAPPGRDEAGLDGSLRHERAVEPRPTDLLAKPALRVTATQQEQIFAHSKRDLPNIACGILGGVGETVMQVYETTNSEASRFSYSVAPTDLLRVYRELEAKGWTVVSIYSSKPDGEGHPSPADVRMAKWPKGFYAYIAFDSGEPSLRAFTIVEGRVVEHEVAITES